MNFLFILICGLRSLLGMILFALLTLFCSLSVILLLLFNKNGQSVNPIVTIWAKGTLFLFGVKVLVKSNPSLSEDMKNSQLSYLLIFNHSSFLDIFVISSVHPEIRFGAKSELFKIPFFGYAMKKSGILPIHRNKKEKTFKVYEYALSRIEKGHHFALSPEGGRGPGTHVLPFKAGPFVFAIRGQIPIIPVLIKGAYSVWPKGAWLPNSKNWTTSIELEYLDKIETKGLTLDDRASLQKKSYEFYMSKFKD